MITVSEKRLANLPVLELVASDKAHQKLPLVVFYHGWTNCKELVLTQGYALAKRGLRVVLPEALYHGARTEGPIEEHYLSFWDIILQSVREFPQIVGYYREKNLILADQVGVGGFSMGGITACALMAAYPKISAAVVLAGTPAPVKFAKIILANLPQDVELSPEYVKSLLNRLAEYDLSLHPDKVGGRPLHFWHGTADQRVPENLTQEFVEEATKQTDPLTSHVSGHFSQGVEHSVDYAVTEEMANKFYQYFH